MNSPFWQKHVYRYVVLVCGLYVLLTIVSMFTYPGGTFGDSTTVGYDFFRNFFSDLGRVTAPNGQSNIVSMVLFFTALNLAGIGLAFFFIAFRKLFKTDRIGNRLSLVGTLVGAASGLCFASIAWVPYDLHFDLHYQLVFWAFRTFLLGVGIYAYVIFRQEAYPRRYGWIFVAFALCLAAYIGLLQWGPRVTTPSGVVIQATGQKIITYVSVVSVMAQSWLAYNYRSVMSQRGLAFH